MNFLAFGEILWDVFSDGRRLGGAPLNVTGHIAKMGGQATIISALSDDELGRAALSDIRALGIDDKYIKQSTYPTGRADIVLDSNGVPTYEFNDPCAWDDITLTSVQLAELASCQWDVFCFGTLAQRSEGSRRTLEQLLDVIDSRIFFFDVNLRKHFYSKEILKNGISKCNILKMNDEEVPIIAEALGFTGADIPSQILESHTTMDIILVTEGKKGTTAYTRTGKVHKDVAKVKVVDTVGAGDSLSAGFLFSLSKGDSLTDAVRKASDLADFVVSHAGAIPEYDQSVLSMWK
ncbi:MAG: carbohydrate kinase [Spirochaetia bacterium]|jgi:fructokinase|nr:carbohydrate kinase [Spirochaetia bacterium]